MAPNNPMSCWGNDKTMNLNPLILTNIQASPYFKVQLYDLKTYHEVIDEIYYKVSHLEPWEKGSRKTAGQTGMCGGVRGVGAGGIVSSAYCLLYKLFTLKLTRKQVIGLCEHSDSPYIRGLGFMFIRYTQDPKDIWDWFEPYFDDDEEVDVKAGGGHTMLIGDMLKQWMTKLEWYATLFPRIPVPVQKDIDMKMRALIASQPAPPPREEPPAQSHDPHHIADEDMNFGEAEKMSSRRSPDRDRERERSHSHRPPPPPPRRSPPRHRSPRRSPPRQRRSPPRYRSRTPPTYRSRTPPKYKSRSPVRQRSRSPARRRSRSPHRRSPHGFDYARELQREKERQTREKKGSSSRERRRSRSRERHHHKKHISSRSGSQEREKKKHKHRDREHSEKSRSKNGHV